MAKIRQRSWSVPGQRTKRRAWGFVTVAPGEHRGDCAGGTCSGCRQVRKFNSEWSREDAENALAAFKLKIEEPKPKASGMTFGQAVARYVAGQARRKSIANVARHLNAMAAFFGPETPLADITAARISEWKDTETARTVPCDRCPHRDPETNAVLHAGGRRPVSVATVNRPLAALRHLLRRAHDEWQVLATVPRITTDNEPEGRIRWLEPDEEARLLAACRASRNPELARIVTIALETGLRRRELLGLTWNRVDLSRGVIRLEKTKSGKVARSRCGKRSTTSSLRCPSRVTAGCSGPAAYGRLSRTPSRPRRSRTFGCTTAGTRSPRGS
jgi:hypothetical protein